MASVKRDQILQEADKLAAKGKVDLAIKEYRRALDLLPNDTNTLNRLGDLLVRVSRIPEAIEVYEKIAERFSEDGFFLKAIAIYKKVNRLDPQLTRAYERLGDLYFKQGLVVEGRQQLITLADWYLRNKQPAEAVRVYRRLIDLEPNNFSARAKLVDLLVQIGDVAGVSAEIDSLGRSLLSRNMLDEAVKLYHRALELKPEKGDFVAPCVDALVSAGRQTAALELANRAMSVTKGGTELQRSAARAAAETGDFVKARELLEQLLADVGERTDIVQLYGDVMLRVGEAQEAKDFLLPAADRLLKAGDITRAGALVKRLLRSAPGDIDVLERALRVFDRRRDPDMVMSVEAALADAYVRADRGKEALDLYRGLVRSNPQNALFAQRVKELGEGRDPSASGPQSPQMQSPSSAEGEAAKVDADFEMVDLDVPLEISDSEPDTQPGQASITSRIPPVVEAQPAPQKVSKSTHLAELYTEAVVFSKYGLADKAIAHLQRLLAEDPNHAQGQELLASLGGTAMELGIGEPLVEAPESTSPLRPVDAALVSSDFSVAPLAGEEKAEVAYEDFEPLSFDAAANSFEIVPDTGPTYAPSEPISSFETPIEVSPASPEQLLFEGEPVIEADLFQEDSPEEEIPTIEVVTEEPVKPAKAERGKKKKEPESQSSKGVRLDDLEAMLGLGRSTPAKTSPGKGKPTSSPAQPADDLDGDLQLVEPKKIAAAQPSTPLARAQAPTIAPPPSLDSANEDIEVLDEPLSLVEVPEVFDGPNNEQLGELDFLIQRGLLDDAAKLLGNLRKEYADHPDLKSRQAKLKAKGWEEEGLSKPESSASELFSEEDKFFDLAAELEKELAEDEMVADATGVGKGSEASIEDLFREFQRGVAEQINSEDFDTHFNLGLAYREMELLDEAIGEFQLSINSRELFVESATMIGACYIDKGLPDEATGWYEKALSDTSLPVETSLGLRYELGKANEAAGRTVEAISHYSKVLTQHPGFRDVVERVARLRSN